MQKSDGTNKCYLAQKKVVLEFSPWQIAVPRRITPTLLYHDKEYSDLISAFSL